MNMGRELYNTVELRGCCESTYTACIGRIWIDVPIMSHVPQNPLILMLILYRMATQYFGISHMSDYQLRKTIIIWVSADTIS